MVAELDFFPETAPIFVILYTFPSPWLMQAEQSFLSKTLKRITGLLKYKNCKYFIYLSFFLLRLPLSLVTEFCLLGFKWRAKSIRRYSSKPNGILLHQHPYTHRHIHTEAHIHRHTHTEAHTHRHTHTHTRTPPSSLSLALP